MTEAKELDPAVRLNALDEAIETLRFNVRHLIAEDDKDDALRTLEVARDVMASVAETLASLPRLEALTAPVALEVKPLVWEDKRNGLFLARTAFGGTVYFVNDRTSMWLGRDDDWAVATDPRAACQADYSARIRSAIHPAPSREAVIDRAAIIEECARVAENFQSEKYYGRTAFATEIAAAIRSLPSNAPSLGEARLAEGEPVFTYTRTFNAIAAAVEWKPNNAFGISVRKFVEAFGPNPSHVQAEAGEAVVTTPPKISELANDLWEALFGIMRGAVPDDLTNEVLNQLAARMAVAYSISERAAP